MKLRPSAVLKMLPDMDTDPYIRACIRTYFLGTSLYLLLSSDRMTWSYINDQKNMPALIEKISNINIYVGNPHLVVRASYIIIAVLCYCILRSTYGDVEWNLFYDGQFMIVRGSNGMEVHISTGNRDNNIQEHPICSVKELYPPSPFEETTLASLDAPPNVIRDELLDMVSIGDHDRPRLIQAMQKGADIYDILGIGREPMYLSWVKIVVYYRTIMAADDILSKIPSPICINRMKGSPPSARLDRSYTTDTSFSFQ